MSEEKRKSIRISKPLAVQFGIKKDDYSISWDMSLIKDISETGICLRTGSVLQRDDVCFLRFRMPTNPNENVDISAKVIDSIATQANICTTRLEFFDVSEEQKRLLREYVAWALAKERGNR